MSAPGDDLRRRFEEAIAGASLDDLRRLGQDLFAAGIGDALARDRPELRRPAPEEAVVLRIRVDLDHAKPPIWRRLDIRSDVTLDVVHKVLQAAFGWWDYHLHRFALGGNPFDLASQVFLCPYDVEEGDEDGPPASEVRLDETLQEPGDVLRYVYDYGDSWHLTLRVEKVLPVAAEAPIAFCVDGRRAAPPEDSGGIADAESLSEVLDDPAHFDIDAVAEALEDAYFALRDDDVDPELVLLVDRLGAADIGGDIALRAAELLEPADEPTPEEKAESLRSFQWFLERASADGMELTAAGYLKPADVEAACEILPAAQGWIGKNNREIQTAPLLDFRESLQRIGLLRKRKGRLLLTRAGAAARDDVDALWRHLVGRLIPDGDAFAGVASRLILLYTATGDGAPVPVDRIAPMLGGLGWRLGDGGALRGHDLWHFAGSPFVLLDNVASGSVGRRRDRGVSPVAAALARTVLRSPAIA